jgi:lipopolysaccharide exporter
VRLGANKLIVIDNILKGLNNGRGFARGSTGAKALWSSISLTAGVVVGRGSRLVRNIILARLLASDDFGLIAIVMAASLAFEAFTEVGVQQSVIQNPRGEQFEYLNGAWWTQVVRGTIIILLAIVAAPLIAAFYHKPELTELIRVCFFAVLFKLLQSPALYALQKKFQFHRVVLVEQGSALLGTLVTIGLAFLFRNVWSLVIGYVAEMGLICFMSYIFAPFKPRMGIDRQCLSELMKFGRGMFGLPVLTMFSFQLDVFVLGKVVSSELLGSYYLALSLTSIPIDLFSRVITPVLLPVFAERQTDSSKILEMVLKIVRLTTIISLPMAVVLAGCAKPIMLITYGAKYAVAAVPFAILIAFVFVLTQSSIITQLYLGLGSPHLHRRFCVARLAVLAVMMYPLTRLFYLTGAAMAVLLANLIAFGFQLFWIKRLIKLNVRSYLLAYVPSLLMALPSAFTLGLLYLMRIDSPITLLGCNASVLVATYCMGLLLLFRRGRSFAHRENDCGNSCLELLKANDE